MGYKPIHTKFTKIEGTAYGCYYAASPYPHSPISNHPNMRGPGMLLTYSLTPGTTSSPSSGLSCFADGRLVQKVTSGMQATTNNYLIGMPYDETIAGTGALTQATYPAFFYKDSCALWGVNTSPSAYERTYVSAVYCEFDLVAI